MVESFVWCRPLFHAPPSPTPPSFEVIKDLHLDPVPWTPENILTPSFKLKRADAKVKYARELAMMYSRTDKVAGMDVHQGRQHR